MRTLDKIRNELRRPDVRKDPDEVSALVADSIIATFDGQKETIYSCMVDIANSDADMESRWSSAMTGIHSELIRATGRWTENYASDLLISLDSMRDYIINTAGEYRRMRSDYASQEEIDAEFGPRVFLFAMRASGVDHFEYVRSQMENNMRQAATVFDYYYRKVYAVKITPNDMSAEGPIAGSFSIEFKEMLQSLAHTVWLLGV